jgi:hypothetical protein
MQGTEFEGHLTQIDYAEGQIKRLYLIGLDGRRWLVTIESPEDEDGWSAARVGRRYSGPLALLSLDVRPVVTIERLMS